MPLYRPGEWVMRSAMDPQEWDVKVQPIIATRKVRFVYHNKLEDLKLYGTMLGVRIPLDYMDHDEKLDECWCNTCGMLRARRRLNFE